MSFPFFFKIRARTRVGYGDNSSTIVFVLPVGRGAAGEEMVRGLAAECRLALLLAARPLALEQGTGMVVHQHVGVEVACCRVG